jgi:hypothetical protein
MIISGSDGLEFPDGSDQGTAFTGNAATITSGTLNVARLPTTGVNAASITVGTLPTAQLPSSGVNASSITTGTLVIANGGTNATSASAARTNLGLAIGTDVLAPTGTGTGLTALNGSNVTSGTIAVARLGSGTPSASNFLRGDGSWQVAGGDPTTTQVLNATAGASLGAVGTYAFLKPTNSTAYAENSTLAGSSLAYSGALTDAGGSQTQGGTTAGTWRLMGRRGNSVDSGFSSSLWLRIS